MPSAPTAEATRRTAGERHREFRVITCQEWGARPPKAPIPRRGRPERIIFHHTEGHAPNVDRRPGESLQDAMGYARQLQNDHMTPKPRGRGWNDSGHNFLITRSGHILEGRHGSWAAIKAGRMGESAHCPGQNDQPGIEHEHYGNEGLTAIQKQASIWLHASICRYTGIRPTEIDPHRRWYATQCPTDELVDWLPTLRLEVAKLLTNPPDDKWLEDWMRWWQTGRRGARPADAPPVIPKWAWKRLQRFVAKNKNGR